MKKQTFLTIEIVDSNEYENPRQFVDMLRAIADDLDTADHNSIEGIVDAYGSGGGLFRCIYRINSFDQTAVIELGNKLIPFSE